MTFSKSEKFQQGLAIRRAVLGEDYVAKALANVDALSEPLQTLVTEYCWGEVWSRDGLDRKIRSLLNIAMLSCLNRPDELSLHLHGALRNGCSHEEISEVILQLGIYAGVPAAIDTMRRFKTILADQEAPE
jgi:4-carboxymuconolactone decarboxylase